MDRRLPAELLAGLTGTDEAALRDALAALWEDPARTKPGRGYLHTPHLLELLFRWRAMRSAGVTEDGPVRDLFLRIHVLVDRQDRRPEYAAIQDALDLLFKRFWRPTREQLEPHLAAYAPYREALEQSFSEHPIFVERYYKIGRHLFDVKDYEGAYGFLRLVVDSPHARPAHWAAYANLLAVGHLKQGRYLDEIPRLVENLAVCAEAYPKMAGQFLWQRAMLLDVHLSDPAGAIAGYRAAMARNDTFTPILNNLAYLLYSHEQNGEEALDLATRAVALDGDSSSANQLHTLALLTYEVAADPARATELALALDPEHGASAFLLGRLLKGEDRLEEAREYLELALRIEPGNTTYQQALAS